MVLPPPLGAAFPKALSGAFGKAVCTVVTADSVTPKHLRIGQRCSLVGGRSIFHNPPGAFPVRDASRFLHEVFPCSNHIWIKSVVLEPPACAGSAHACSHSTQAAFVTSCGSHPARRSSCWPLTESISRLPTPSSASSTPPGRHPGWGLACPGIFWRTTPCPKFPSSN